MSAPRVAIGLLAIGGLVAACTRLPLAWDGSYVTLNVLWMQEPFMPHGRWVNLPLQAPALLASRWITDTAVLSMILGASYALLPAMALAASWWVTRDRSPGLLVWPAMSIGLLALPGQAFFVSEAMFSTQLIWPLVLAVTNGTVYQHRILLAIVALVVAASHPIAIALLAMTLLMAALPRAGRWPSGRRLSFVAAGIAVLVLLGARYLAGANSYESDQISLGILTAQARTLDVRQVGAIELVYLTAIGLVVSRNASALLKRPLELMTLAALIGAGALLIGWATDPLSWAKGLEYRGLVLFVSGAMYVAAFVDGRGLRPRALRPPLPRIDRKVVLGTATVWAAVIVIQGLSWHATLRDFFGYLEQSPTACVPASDIRGLEHSPLNHWSVTTLSLLVAGREPGRLVLMADSCEQRLADGFPISGVETRDWESRWFTTEPLRRAIAMERVVAAP